MEKYGIQNLKEVLAFGVKIGTTLKDDLADKKISLTEVLELLPQLMKIPDFVSKKDELLKEVEDLSIPEIEELMKTVEGITSDQVVLTIKDSLNIGVSVRNLIERFAHKPAA